MIDEHGLSGQLERSFGGALSGLPRSGGRTEGRKAAQSPVVLVCQQLLRRDFTVHTITY